MRVLLLAALIFAGGCAAKEVAPTFAMYSPSHHELVVQVTTDHGDRRDCEVFWNLFRKDRNQVCVTDHRRSKRWVRVGDDRRVGAVIAKGAVADDDSDDDCIVDGEITRCADQRVTIVDDRVVVEVEHGIAGCADTQRVAHGSLCLHGRAELVYRLDDGRAITVPADLFAVAVDGKSVTVVHRDPLATHIATFALDGNVMSLVRERDFAVFDPGDRYSSVGEILDVTPDGDHVMVRRDSGCDVVEVATRQTAHELSCGDFVGDVAYVIPGPGAELVMLDTQRRTALGDLIEGHLVDTGAMVERGKDRIVVLRRADAAVVSAPVEALANRIVVSDRIIAAVSTPYGRPHHVVIIDRAAMTARVVEVAPTIRGVIGIAGDTVLFGVRRAHGTPESVLAISASGRQETIRVGR